MWKKQNQSKSFQFFPNANFWAYLNLSPCELFDVFVVDLLSFIVEQSNLYRNSKNSTSSRYYRNRNKMLLLFLHQDIIFSKCCIGKLVMTSEIELILFGDN